MPWQNSCRSSGARPNRSLIGKKVGSLLVSRGARHHIERNALAAPATDRPQAVDVDLEERSGRQRSERQQPLGMGKTEPRTLTAGNENHADFTVAQFGFAACQGFGGCEFVVRIAETNGPRRLCPLGQIAPVRTFVSAGHQVGNQLEGSNVASMLSVCIRPELRTALRLLQLRPRITCVAVATCPRGPPCQPAVAASRVWLGTVVRHESAVAPRIKRAAIRTPRTQND